MVQDHRQLLLDAAMAGINACQPSTCLPELLPTSSPQGRTIVVGAGKAAGEMAAIATNHLSGDVSGLVVTRYGHTSHASTGNIEVIESGHPIPDDQSQTAALRMLDLVSSSSADDRVIFLISGGGSSLLSCPADGLSAEEKRGVHQALVKSGATIHEINTVRVHLSKVKGGRLATAAHTADLHTYVISDVVGDDPAFVASGPSIGWAWQPDAARLILDKYAIPITEGISEALNAPPILKPRQHSVHVIATADRALSAMQADLTAKGYECLNIGADLEGDARKVGQDHAKLALEAQKSKKRCAVISGGELTVRVTNPNGRGGPNLEYLTGFMVALGEARNISAISLDSDGIDGSEDNAGGIVDGTSLARAQRAHLDPGMFLTKNLTYDLFSGLGDLVVTGPTLTNVNDVRVILIDNA